MSDQWVTVDLPAHPLPNGRRWVAVEVDIRDNATGVVRTYQTEDIIEPGEDEPSDFAWSEGGYGCDCNRRLFFARAAREPEDWDGPCSDGLYSVRVRNPVTGRAFYDELKTNP